MIRKICAHAAIILSAMYFVFYAIDRVNSAMNFINNELTKGLLVALGVLSVINALTVLAFDRREAMRLWRKQNQRRGEKAER